MCWQCLYDVRCSFFLLRLPQPQGDKEDFSEYEGAAMDRSTLGNLLANAWHTFICEVELLQNQKMLLCQENSTHQKKKKKKKVPIYD